MSLRKLCLPAAVAVLAVLFVQPGASSGVRDGGIFRVSFPLGLGGFDHVDPALAYSRESWSLLDTTCARLMRYADKPPPAGYRLVPEVATDFPKVSADGRTYTFTLRKGFRFNDGSPVRADAFAQAIARTLAPGVRSPALRYTQAIVGAEDVLAGHTPRPSGVTARGRTLIVRFTKEIRGFAAWTTMPFFCAVPPTLPPNPEGVRRLPGAGPYYVQEYVPGRRVKLRRNRFYGGTRSHHVDGFDVDLSADSPQQMLDRVESGKADWGYTLAGVHLERERALFQKYGNNEKRFFVNPGLTLKMYVLNSSRPLFRDNPKLRLAVNLALDRTSLSHPAGGRWTDQYIPEPVPGHWDKFIHPLGGDPARAKTLARRQHARRQGRPLRHRLPQPCETAQLVKQQLAPIGLDVEIKPFGGARRRARPTSAGSGIPASRGISPSSSGRPTSSIRRGTSTRRSTPRRRAAPTSPASTRGTTASSCAAQPACRARRGRRPTETSTCCWHARPPRSYRSTSSTRRPSSPRGSAASCDGRRSSSPRYASRTSRRRSTRARARAAGLDRRRARGRHLPRQLPGRGPGGVRSRRPGARLPRERAGRSSTRCARG